VSSLKSFARLVELNAAGLRVDEKIIIIESDDWGSIRSSRDFVSSYLPKKYKQIANSVYLQNDSLESKTDLEMLFEVLGSFKDDYGNKPLITANTVVANPDFNTIKASGFKTYTFEPFTETLMRRDGDNAVYSLFQLGQNQKIFIPQFHGREHVNVKQWLNLLEEDTMFREAFEYGVWGLSRDIRPDLRKSVQATLDTDITAAKESIISGLALFKNIFGFNSESFIANNFIWDARLNETLLENGVFYLQGMKYQLLPFSDKAARKRLRHHFGERNKFDQIYGVRNCSLEVSEGISSVDSCIREVGFAFKMKKPAIVSMHRLNFIGSINPINRENGLDALYKFLDKALKKWPNVRFMSTPQFNKYIRLHNK
jgi:hypothetical protein